MGISRVIQSCQFLTCPISTSAPTSVPTPAFLTGIFLSLLVYLDLLLSILLVLWCPGVYIYIYEIFIIFIYEIYTYICTQPEILQFHSVCSRFHGSVLCCCLVFLCIDIPQIHYSPSVVGHSARARIRLSGVSLSVAMNNDCVQSFL